MFGLWRRGREDSDEEHIERLRRGLAALDRLRRPLLAFWLTMAVAYVGLVVAAVRALRSLVDLMPGGAQGIFPGFVLGLGLGTSLGVLALKITHWILTLLIGFRNERLLIRYHDALCEAEQEAPESEEAEAI